MAEHQSGQLFVVSAPSGVGKTTVLQGVFERMPQLRFSVSCTTRPRRPGEKDGVDYHFLSRNAFEEGIREGRFLEWAVVHGHYYGTDRREVEGRLSEGWDVVLEIDVQGARQVRASFPTVVTIFILPPSIEVLEERLRRRGTESADQLALRLKNARSEILEAPWYDYIVINDVLEEAIEDMSAIFRSLRCHRSRAAVKLRPFLTQAPFTSPPG